ncbi:MAG: RNA methyltransferase [Bacteroidetes bacterium]|nr:RNA methyltransferase [Bacteroidota bacterium]
MRKLKTHELKRLSVEQYKDTKKNPVVIVLDNVRSLNNVGTAFRSSDAFLAEKIYLCGITGKPPHREINKTALGAAESVEWEYVKNTIDIIKKLKKEGYTIIALEQTDESRSLQDFQPQRNKKYCFVFGNEVFGISDEVVNNIDLCLEIPQFGTKHSINIAVSIGIVLWDYISKIKNKMT